MTPDGTSQMPSRPPPFEQPIFVTRPLMPPLDSYIPLLEGIWSRRWLTNKGALHDQFEDALRRYLKAEHVSLVSNGTSGLMLACWALGLKHEVITTPLTSPATVHALTRCGLTPVFADVLPAEMTINPAAVEQAITPRTTAIVAVHLYGMPCRVDALQDIANLHRLRLVFDGAHAFGTEIDGVPVVHHGDLTALSFHATKLFNTAEGGALVTRNPDLKRQLDLWKNLGIQDELSVVLPGVNARMNELEAALGLANLQIVDAEMSARSAVAAAYLAGLNEIEGLTCFEMPRKVLNRHHYFVLRVDNARSRVSRDQLRARLKPFNVFARAYFCPLCSNLPYYADLPSSRHGNLKVANQIADEVLCLPLYGDLGAEGADRICGIIRHIMRSPN